MINQDAAKTRDAMIEIKRPHLSLFSSFMEFSEEMRVHGETLWNGYYPKEGESPDQFIARLNGREIHPEPPLVPETTYWGVVDDHVVGRISLRHKLEGNLTKIGGNIGYEVRPSYRRKGFAKEMLRQILLTAKAKEIGHLLLTCSPDNPASNKTIIANGGILERTIFVDLVEEDRNHYWITI
jgi:predicted acetyltransferase